MLWLRSVKNHTRTAVTGNQFNLAFSPQVVTVEQCLREGHLVPVCFVSARTGVGVKALLDVATRLFPHPGEANPPPFVKGAGADARPITTTPDPSAHVVADVFRIVHDPFVGKLGVFRVYQGTVRRDTQLFVDDGRKPFKVGHLFRLHGKEHVEVDQAIPGDIAAVAAVVTDGVPRFVGRSRNTPAPNRSVRVTQCRIPQDYSPAAH